VLHRLAHLIFGAEPTGGSNRLSSSLSYGYLLMALMGGLVGYTAGHLSDRFGRRRLILIGNGRRRAHSRGSAVLEG
jgi:MFS family permease